TKTMTALAPGTASEKLDFGQWTPPYAGEYSFTLRPLAPGVSGAASNTLHAGPGATGTFTTSAPTVPPGDSSIGLNIRLTGADPTSVAKVFPDQTALVTASTTSPGNMGADAAGNIYFARIENDPVIAFKVNNVLRKAVPGSSVFVYADPNQGANNG